MSFLISLGIGFGVGIAYFILKVPSPAPPLIALAGLLGMVLGEHAIPMIKAQISLPVRSGPDVGTTKEKDTPTKMGAPGAGLPESDARQENDIRNNPPSL